MKLTATWNNNDGEGRLSQADVKRLMEDLDIATVDFLQDIKVLVEELYAVALKKWHDGLTAGLVNKTHRDD